MPELLLPGLFAVEPGFLAVPNRDQRFFLLGKTEPFFLHLPHKRLDRPLHGHGQLRAVNHLRQFA